MARIRANRVIMFTREAHRRHGNEGANDGYRHRGGGNENGAPVLKEDHDHQQDEDGGFEEGLVDLIDGSPGESGRIERYGILDPFRKALAEPFHGVCTSSATSRAFAPGS